MFMYSKSHYWRPPSSFNPTFNTQTTPANPYNYDPWIQTNLALVVYKQMQKINFHQQNSNLTLFSIGIVELETYLNYPSALLMTNYGPFTTTLLDNVYLNIST